MRTMDDKENKTADTKGDRLTDSEFAAAKERYELGTDNLIDLAAEFGVSRQALSGRFKRNGVVKGSRVEEIAKAAAEEAKKNAVASVRFAEKKAEWIEETRVQGVQALKQARLIGQKMVIDQMKSKAPNLESIEGSIKAIARHSKMLTDNIESSLRILQADEYTDPEDLPNLLIEDLTDQEILQHHINTGALEEGTTVEEMLHDEIQIEEIE